MRCFLPTYLPSPRPLSVSLISHRHYLFAENRRLVRSSSTGRGTEEVGTDPFFREPFVWLDQSYEEDLVYLSRAAPTLFSYLTSADGDTSPAFYYIVSTPPIMLLVKLLSPNATMPTRWSPESAGFDLCAAEPKVVPAGGMAVIKTDLSVACPEGTYARIAPRSGVAVKRMIGCGAGVVDADYRGNVGVVLFNFGHEDFHVYIGDRIAQLILERISMVHAVQVDELTETQRGVGGFGSTSAPSSRRDKSDLPP